MSEGARVSWQRRFVAWLLGHRALVLVTIALISAVATAGALRIQFDSSVEIWFLEKDPVLVSFREFKERFEADRIAVVGVFADSGDVFAPDVMAAIDRIVDGAEEIEWVTRVTALTNLRLARSIDDSLEITEFAEDLPTRPAESKALRARALAHPLLPRNLIAADGRATAIVVELSPEANTTAGQKGAVSGIEALLAAERRDGLRLLQVGSPALAEAMSDRSQEDSATLGPASLLLVLGVTFFVYRRVSAALVPISVCVLAILWTNGLMGWLGWNSNPLTSALGMLIVAVGVADSVHVLSDYYRHLMVGEEPAVAVERSVADLLVPCFFTSATTMAGLLSLRVSEMKPIAQFGTMAAVGVGFAFLLSVTLVPIVLRLVRPPDPRFIERQRKGTMSRLLGALGSPGRGPARITLAAGLLLFAAGAFGASRLDVVSTPMNYFYPDDPIRVNTTEVDQAIGGTATAEFLVYAPDQGMKSPRTLRRLEAFQSWIETRPGMARSFSAVTSVTEMNRVMLGSATIPDEAPLIAQYYLLLEGEEDFDRLLQDNYSVARITARANLSEADRVVGEFGDILNYLDENLSDDGIRVEATGFLALVTKMEAYLIRSQIQSFLIAIAVITAMMTGLLRSVRLGLLSVIPNLVPVALGAGLMSALGIPIDTATVMIPTIAIGLVVDDSVHFLFRFRGHSLAGASVEEAIRRTVEETGRPIVVTSLILSLGFATLGLGNFVPIVYFGSMSAAVVLLALFATLLLLPAVLITLRPDVRRAAGIPPA